MGRYYNGDIEGKFWFAVQPSDDADFFGVEGQANYISYYFDEDNLEDIQQGIKQCEEALGNNKAMLDTFFNEHHGYNDKKIVDYFQSKYSTIIEEKDVKEMLGWYARLGLGNQIWECVKEHGSCSFDAEC